MTEGLYKGIEAASVTLLSAGVDYVVTKVINNTCNPETIPEKIATGVGTVAVSLACDYGIYRMIHGLMYPSEADKYEMLLDETKKTIQMDAQVAKEMVIEELEIKDAVGEILNKINGGIC